MHVGANGDPELQGSSAVQAIHRASIQLLRRLRKDPRRRIVLTEQQITAYQLSNLVILGEWGTLHAIATKKVQRPQLKESVKESDSDRRIIVPIKIAMLLPEDP